MILRRERLKMNIDLEKTRHYTTEAKRVCKNLTNHIPDTAILIEPFVGEGHLLSLFPNHNWITYDINDDVKADFHQDTLKKIPDYSNKWVITNPPYLAKNKAKEKSYFKTSKYNDLYKISLASFIGCEGGIVIIPLNFLTDEGSKEIRKDFLSKYQIVELNIFTQPVFETTTYSVCAFAFIKKENDYQKITATIYPGEETLTYIAEKRYNYRMAGDFFDKIEKEIPIFNRLTDKNTTDYITNMKLYALDTRTERIHIKYPSESFIGKNSDRTYLTFTSKKFFSENQQELLARNFNKNLNEIRDKYKNLIFTNYRDWNRKRIGFDFAYKFLSLIAREMK